MLIFVFDFDYTLSDIHTKGNPDHNKYYITQSQLNILWPEFLRIKENKNNLIMILSRTPQLRLADYLAKKYDYLYKLIDNMYGPDIKEYNDNENEQFWAQWKVEYLIFIKYMHPKHNVFFFDDTEANITEALNVKDINAIRVETPSYIGDRISKVLNKQIEEKEKPAVYHTPVPTSTKETFVPIRENVPSEEMYVPPREQVPSETKQVPTRETPVDIERRKQDMMIAVNKTLDYPTLEVARNHYLRDPNDKTIAILNYYDGHYMNGSEHRSLFKQLTREEEDFIKEIDSKNAVDLTSDFNGNVNTAISYYKNNPDDHKIAKILSSRRYYYNSRLDFTEFEHIPQSMTGGKEQINYCKNYSESKNNYLNLLFHN